MHIWLLIVQMFYLFPMGIKDRLQLYGVAVSIMLMIGFNYPMKDISISFCSMIQDNILHFNCKFISIQV